jgi:beta-glucanase (GH16 family)
MGSYPNAAARVLWTALLIACAAAWVGLAASAGASGRRHDASQAGSRDHAHRRRHGRRRILKRVVDPTPPAAIGPSSALGAPLWTEEFEGPAGSPPDPSRWSFDTGGGGWGNAELQSYTARPENAELDGEGHLMITARQESYVGADGIHREYTSARLQTLEKFEFTYGVLEARIEVPSGQGLAPAFWTLGDDAYRGRHGWPRCGEIDAMEVFSSQPDTVHGHVHGPWPAYPQGIGGAASAPEPLSSGYHVYAVEWNPEQISFALDGKTYETVSRSQLPAGYPWPFERPNFILLNLAVGGEWPGPPNASTQFPARMLVDWVRVWR